MTGVGKVAVVTGLWLSIAATSGFAQFVINVDLSTNMGDVVHVGSDGVFSTGGSLWNNIYPGLSNPVLNLDDENGATTAVDVAAQALTFIWSFGNSNTLQDSGWGGNGSLVHLQLLDLNPRRTYDLAVYMGYPGDSEIQVVDERGVVALNQDQPDSQVLPGVAGGDYLVFTNLVPTLMLGWTYGFDLIAPPKAVSGNTLSGFQLRENVASGPPSCSAPVYPADAQPGVGVVSDLIWKIAPFAAGYQFYLGTNDPPTSVVNGLEIGDITKLDVSNLSYNTTYYWQMIPTNTFGVAVACPVWSFRTQWDPALLACVLTESFDAFPEGLFSGTLFGWVNDVGDDGNWRIHRGRTFSNNTGPTDDHTTGSGRYAYLESSFGEDPGNPSSNALLLTPQVDISALEPARLAFWYHLYGASMGDLHVDVFSSGVWSNDVIPALSGNVGEAWLRQVVDLTGFSSPLRIRFRGVTGSGFHSDLAIDDVTICGRAIPGAATIGDVVVAGPWVSLSLTNLTLGATNRVERSFDLLTNGWQEVGTFVSTGATETWSQSVSSSWSRVFYRLQSR